MGYDEWQQRQEQEKIDKEEKRYFFKQRMIGASLIITSILISILDMDITIALVLIPLGAYIVYHS